MALLPIVPSPAASSGAVLPVRREPARSCKLRHECLWSHCFTYKWDRGDQTDSDPMSPFSTLPSLCIRTEQMRLQAPEACRPASAGCRSCAQTQAVGRQLCCQPGLVSCTARTCMQRHMTVSPRCRGAKGKAPALLRDPSRQRSYEMLNAIHVSDVFTFECCVRGAVATAVEHFRSTRRNV